MTEIPPTGTRIADKYIVTGLLGEGGMSVVLHARHVARDATVAIKVIRPQFRNDAQAISRLKHEAMAASRLRTDHAVSVFDVGELPDGAPFLVMEFLDGEDLEQVLTREGRLERPRAVHIVLQVLRALGVGHEAGVIHRDIKPGNVHLSERDGETEFVKLLDFGISHIDALPGVRLTASHHLMGTPLYMPPEQARDPRSVVPASDLYAVGALLYECLSGRPPFDEETVEAVLHRVFSEPPPRLDQVEPTTPTRLAEVVARALAKDPLQRFANAREMALALAPFADDRSNRVLASFELAGPRSQRSREATGDLPTVALTRHPTVKRPLGALSLFAVGCAGVAAVLIAIVRPASMKSASSDPRAASAPASFSSLGPTPTPAAVFVPSAPSSMPQTSSSSTPTPLASQRAAAPATSAVRPRRQPPPSSPFELEILR